MAPGLIRFRQADSRHQWQCPPCRFVFAPLTDGDRGPDSRATIAAVNASKGKRTNSTPLRVAVCIDTRDGPGRQRLLGVYRYALQHGWRVFLVRGYDEMAIRQLPGMKLDAAILYDRPRRLHQRLRRLGVVCVEAGARNLALDDGAVFMDDASLTHMATQHLLDAGYEHFAYCGLVDITPSQNRAQHFQSYLKPRGYCAAVFEETLPDGEAELEGLIDWLGNLSKPVGVLAFDDKMAERVLAACRWRNIAVPGDIGVIGIGDDELICDLAYPALSSVVLPTLEIGRCAAELVDELIAGKTNRPRFQPMPPIEVIARASTQRTPTAHPTVVAAVQFIRAHAHRSIGTDQIASAVGVPRRTLERRFVSELRRTIHDFLVDERLASAKRLLRQSRAPLGEIAQATGYGALSAFTRMFSERTGSHPEAYREQHRLSRGS
jgi:LacI family transcriptional regulator